MTDGSYVEVTSETYPAKVSWASGDHSAITTSQPGVYISKWNAWPLMRHNWDDSPFGTTNIKYYILCTESLKYTIISADYTNITGCDFKIEDVTIQNNADVNIEAKTVQIDGSFNATLGTTLEIK